MATPTQQSTSPAPSPSKQTGPYEEDLKRQLQASLQTLTRKEPLEATYKHLLTKGIVTHVRPTLPKYKLYKPVTSRLRERVEDFMQSTQGGDPWDRITSRETIEEEALRAAITLRECKQHEQEALLAATLAALPRRKGLDEASRRRKMEGMALGLQARERKARREASKALAEDAAINEQLDRERAVKRARDREAARKRRENEERRRLEMERAEALRRSRMVETPQQALHRLYEPIFRFLWGMEFANLHGTNPFRIVIDRENCAAMGAPDYFDVVKTPMNLSYIKRKVDGREYQTLAEFFQDVELMLDNALLYNSDPSNNYHIAAKEMKRKYKKNKKRVIQSVKQIQQSK